MPKAAHRTPNTEPRDLSPAEKDLTVKQVELVDATTKPRNPSPAEKWDEEEGDRVRRFIRENRDADTPYPIPGLTLNFRLDNGAIRMQLDVTERPSFMEAVKKHRMVLDRWRRRLTAFEQRAKWEQLPHPATMVIARSTKGQACLDWLSRSAPELWLEAMRNRKDGLSPGRLAQELNATIEQWLKKAVNPKTRGVWRHSMWQAVILLRLFGFRESDAEQEIGELLEALREERKPFDRGRARHCRPITREMVRKRLDTWTA